MQKPTGVTVTAGIMALSIIAGLAFAFTRPLPPMPAMPNSPISASGYGGIVHGVVIVFSLIAAVFVWFYWNGHNWARWLVMIDSVYQIYKLIHISTAWSTSHVAGGLLVVDAALAAFLLWYLNTREIRNWFSPPSVPGQPASY
jgi:hypothetical protein